MTDTLRPVSSTVETDLSRRVTLPGFLVRIGFPSALLASSRGEVIWNGSVFVPFGIEVSGFDTDSTKSSTSGRITFLDIDDAITNLILTHGAAERSVIIWQTSSDAPGDDDPVLYFRGTVDEVEIDVDKGLVSMSCMTPMGTWYSPRMYVDAMSGFTNKMPNDPRFGAPTIRWFNGEFISFHQSGS